MSLSAVLAVLLIGVAGWSSPSGAEEREQSVRLDEVVVTATRSTEEIRKIPANVSVITAEDIEQSGATSIVEVLEKLESVNVRSYSGNPSQAFVDLRGMGGDNPFGKVLVMLDGRRMNRPDMASINWLQVPLATVDRIEVVRGTGSVLYGDAAVAGVINIITKKGDGPPRVDGGVIFGSYGLQNERLGVSGSHERLSYSLSGENMKTSGYRDRSAFSSKGAAFDLGCDATDSVRLSFGVSYNETDYQLPGTLTKEQMALNRRQFQPAGLWTPAHDGDESSDRYTNLNLSIDSILGNYSEFSLGFAYGTKELETDMPSFWAPGQYNRYKIDTLAVTPRYIYKRDILGFANKLTAGLDYYDETMDMDQFGTVFRTDPANAVELTKRSVGAYIHNEFSIGPSLILSTGFRKERASISGDYRDFSNPATGFNVNKKVHRGTAWEAGLTWLFKERSNMYARYGTFYRYPFLDEQATYHAPPIGFLTDLERERGSTIEAGSRFFLLNDNLRVGIAGYMTDMQDQIVYVGFFPAGQNRNLDKTRHQGLELNARYRFVDLFLLEGNATFNKSHFREGQYSGRDVPLAPRTMAYLALEVFLPGDLVLRPEVHRVGDAFLADDFENNAEKLEGRTLGSLFLYYRPLKDHLDLSAFFGIENITDEEYVTTGRDGSPWSDNTYYPAPGRTIKGGLSVRF